MKLRLFLLIAATTIFMQGCCKKCQPAKVALDYSLESSWAHTDSLSKPVDVFFVYPTIYADQAPLNMDITSPQLQKRVQNVLSSQAGVFVKSCNLFAPYYRQMSMAALDSSMDMFENQYFRVGAEDIASAFEYYLDVINPDRPFILAGHSQGAMVLIDLMKKKFNDPALQNRLVVAYLIGYSVTKQDSIDCPWMKLAQKADDTGVIITYNTQSPDAKDSPVLLEGAMCINPLSWTTSPEPADKSLNLGAVFFKDGSTEIEREVPEYLGAKINPDTGALEVAVTETLNVGSFPAGVYHKFDYAFWYRNLEENVRIRVQAYLNEK